MATLKVPLLTRVALTDCWAAGWLLLRSADGWPQAASALLSVLDVDITGKRGWLGRRAAMRKLSVEFLNESCVDLYRGAILLATNPAHADQCAAIAWRLQDELREHGQGDIVKEVIIGWAALADGCCIVDGDPIKAARDASRGEIEFTASDVMASDDGGVTSPALPTSEDLGTAPILDDWELLERQGATSPSARGMVSGSIKYADGQNHTTRQIIGHNADMSWIRTADGVYRLGYRKHEHTPIVRAALKATRHDAYNLIFGITGNHTLESVILKSARAVGAVLAGNGERTAAAKAVADALYGAGRTMLAHAWYLLAADDVESCILANSFLRADAGTKPITAVQTVVLGWQMIAADHTAGEDMSDPIAAAHRIGDRHMRNDAMLDPDEPPESKVPPTGVMVIPSIGGAKETSSGREAIREFKDIVGKRMPMAKAPDMSAVRRILHDEYPHVHTQINTLLTGMVEGEPIRWRNCLLTGSPGSGKSRLVRRLAETLGVGLHRFDAAGSADNAFSGTPRRWSSGEPCVPLEAVRRYKIANPLVMVDEIDKGSNSRHNGSAENSLQPFLEPETSRAYPDPYVERDIDVSAVGFMLTCNVETALPGPLRDRLLVVRMPDPKIEHMPALVRGIVADIGRAHGDPRWVPMLSDGELMVAEGLWKGGSVRRLRAIVERILAYREGNPRN
jgi:ATPase family associated with various cellular activities (AAA)